MVARKGYKLTEVGEIPEDWEILPLGTIATFRTGPFGSTLHKTDYVCNGVPVINPMQIIEGKIRPTLSMAVSTSTLQRLSEFILEKDDIILGRRGEMGRCAVIDEISAGWLCGTGSLIIRTQDVNHYFLFRILSSKRVINDLETSSIGTTMTNLNQDILSNLQIQRPPTLKEQTAIATALSDADALIETLEQSIAKKRHIKQGAMQELLTGKKRLPGFVGEWGEVEIGSLLSIAHGKSQKIVEDINGEYPILASGGRIGTANQYIYDKPSILIGRKGTIDKPQYMDAPFWTVDTLFYSRVNNKNVPKFLFYKFCLVDWNKYNEASGVPSLNAKTIESILVAIPPLDKNKEPTEQTAIAAVLTDMDDEIAALETKLTKAKQIKAGMMQELLTGRIRLI